MSTTSTRRAATFEARVLQLLDAQATALATIAERQAAIERRLLPAQGTRECDRALILALADSFGSAPFTARAVFEHLRLRGDATLADAIADADADSARTLGWSLRRLAGHDFDGFTLERAGDSRDGAQWKIMRTL